LLFAGDVSAIFDTFLRRNIPLADETLLALVDGKPYRETPGPVTLSANDSLVARWARLVSTEQGSLDTQAGPVRYMAVPLSDRDGDGNRGVFVVANFMQGEIDEINDVTRIAAFVWGAVVLGAIALGWFVAGRVLGPVRVVTQTARELTESDLSRRIQVSDRGDEIAELARTFNVMLDRLEDAFRQQRRFLDDAGHELRTPLTIVRGHLELAGYDPSERVANRAVLRDELDRMGRIVDHLLLLARAEQPDFLRSEPVDLDLLTAELAAKANALADRDWVVTNVGHGKIVADRHRLTQAVVNLLDNAARNTRAGDRIELGSDIDRDVARIWVRDYGPGVAPEDRARIFDRFARGRDHGSEGGTAGLGLAIVLTIAEAHGGHVTLESPTDGGAVFAIDLPVEDPE
jgi:signal transduction histidine kinase